MEVSIDMLKSSALGFDLSGELCFHNVDEVVEGIHMKPEVENNLRDCNAMYDRIRN